MPKRKSITFRKKRRSQRPPSPSPSPEPELLPSPSLRRRHTATQRPREDREAEQHDDELSSPQQVRAVNKRKRGREGDNQREYEGDARGAARRMVSVAEPVGELEEESGDAEEEAEGEAEAEDSEDSAQSDIDELSRSKFPILKPRHRYIKQREIKRKWQPLGAAGQERVLALFSAIEGPLLSSSQQQQQHSYRHNKGSRRRHDDEAQAVLHLVTRTLGRRLPRMPFPPATRDWHFDYEALLRTNRGLEQQLTAAGHSVALLRAEVTREADGLAQDADELDEVRRNAGKEARLRKAQRAKRHKLLLLQKQQTDEGGATPQQPKQEEEGLGDGPEQIRLLPLPTNHDYHHNNDDDEEDKDGDEDGVGDEDDPSLFPLLTQLSSHLRSMEDNTAQVAGLSEEITLAAAQLDALLSVRLPPEAYAGLPGFL